jgi:diguanylate cyclase (GGDEF)-like protein
MLKFMPMIINSLQSRMGGYNILPVRVITCALGLLIHVSFIFLFDYWGVPSLSDLNILSSLLWAWALVEVLRGFTYRSSYIGSFEILLHAGFAMSVLGLDSGFDLYLLPLATWLAFNPNINHKFALIAGSFGIIFWIFGRVYWSHIEDVPVSAETLNVMLRVNAGFTGIVFIFGMISARILVDKHSKKLSEKAGRDELTGLYNRHHLSEYIRRHEQKDLPDRRAYALILTDIDYFKVINDKHGHAVGDRVLEAFSRCLEENVRKDDLVCRWGGEEFMIILPKCSLKKAIKKADVIRRKVAGRIMVDHQVQPIYITASFGVALNISGEYFHDLVSRADKLLYQAKESGRNCVVAQME